jgi:hypothetical protein
MNFKVHYFITPDTFQVLTSHMTLVLVENKTCPTENSTGWQRWMNLKCLFQSRYGKWSYLPWIICSPTHLAKRAGCLVPYTLYSITTNGFFHTLLPLHTICLGHFYSHIRLESTAHNCYLFQRPPWTFRARNLTAWSAGAPCTSKLDVKLSLWLS